MQGQSFGLFHPQAILTTDSSQQSWGAHLHFISPKIRTTRLSIPTETRGNWDTATLTLHINAKELLAVKMALLFWCVHLQNLSVKIESDNKTTVALINNQGTVHSQILQSLTHELLTWSHGRGIRLRAVYLAGIENVLADKLSRPNEVLPTEWSLDQKTVNTLFHQWERPNIDLFADKENYKLPTYVSPTRDPQAFAVDALSLDWKDMFAYAFPPPKLLTKVVHKIQSTPCRLILVTPYWPGMPWFTTVIGLAVKPPIRLTIHPILLQDTVTTRPPIRKHPFR